MEYWYFMMTSSLYRYPKYETRKTSFPTPFPFRYQKFSKSSFRAHANWNYFSSETKIFSKRLQEEEANARKEAKLKRKGGFIDVVNQKVSSKRTSKTKLKSHFRRNAEGMWYLWNHVLFPHCQYYFRGGICFPKGVNLFDHFLRFSCCFLNRGSHNWRLIEKGWSGNIRQSFFYCQVDWLIDMDWMVIDIIWLELIVLIVSYLRKFIRSWKYLQIHPKFRSGGILRNEILRSG